MYVKSLLFAFILGTFYANAALVSVTATSVSTAVLAVQTHSISWPLTAKNITKYTHHNGLTESDVTFYGDRTVAEPPSAVSTYVAKRDASDVASVLSTLTVATFGLAATTCIVAAVATAGVACIFGAVTAGIAVILDVAYVSVELANWNATSTSSKRSDVFIDWEFEQEFQAVEGCGVGCQIRSKVEQSTWTHVGNATVSGTKHKLHFWRSGDLSGLRVQQLGGHNHKRDDDDIYIVTDFQQVDDLIMTFYYVEDSVESIEDWGTDDTTTAANDAANYIVDNNVAMGCYDVGDSDGTVFQSVFLLDDSDLVEELPHDDIASVLYGCYSEDPFTTSPFRKVK